MRLWARSRPVVPPITGTLGLVGTERDCEEQTVAIGTALGVFAVAMTAEALAFGCALQMCASQRDLRIPEFVKVSEASGC